MEEQKPVLRPRTRQNIQRTIEREMKAIIAEDEVADRTTPGSKVDRHLPTARKVPFTMKWFTETYGEDEFDVTGETVPVTINGVTVLFESGKTIKAPKNFIGEYREYLKRLVAHTSRPIEGAPYVLPGAGALTGYGEG